MEPSLFTNSFSDASPLGGVVEGLNNAAQPLAAPTRSTAALPPEVVPGELLVQFRPSIGVSARRDVRSLLGGSRLEAIQTPLMQRVRVGILERIALPDGKASTLQAAIEAISRHPNVAYAEPNYIYRPAAVSNDPYYTNGSLWGMYGDDSPTASGPSGTTNQFGSQAEKAWNDNITGSSNVVVGIIDEGIQVTHPDLANNIWVNPYDPVDGVDNDGNGYIDDVNGWDFVSNDNSVYDAGQDVHGTHVAGTIGGDGGNGQGVAGVNWDVNMISAKFLGTNGGTTSNVIKAVDYLTDLKNRHGINLVASNNSWGGGGYSQGLHDAIIRAAKKDILFIAAAGNSTSNNDTTASYPSNYNTTVGTSTQSAASYDGVIAVASITSTGAISSFSSFGATTVDIGAPGSSINSTVPTNTYANYNGTSMATPHVTGAAALFASVFPAGVPAQTIRSALLSSATPTTSLAGKTVSGGRLNVYAALAQADDLAIEKKVYSTTASVNLLVNHRAANLSASTIDTISVSISSTSESTPETVVLSETGANTGSFSGSIQLDAATPVADGKLQVVHADQITATYAALNRTATAAVDGQAPLISAVSATAKSSSGQIAWTTDEAASTEVLYGTSAGALNSTVTVPGMLTAHTATIRGLSPLTTYYYQVRSQDAAGNISTDPTVYSFTTTALAPILFVDDDLGAAYERFYEAALNANGYAFETWNTSELGATPNAQDLSPFKAVIWNTGYDYSSPGAGLTAPEQTAIASYLDAGGRIYVSGQDILYNTVGSSFQSNYLKVASYTNDVRTTNHTETGVANNPISNGQSLSVAAPSDFPAIYVDAVTPATGAQGTFQHGVTTSTSIHSSVNYRGDYASGGFGMVFTTFPFEAVSSSAADPNNQKVLLGRILDYLGVPRASVNTGALSSNTTTEAGGSASFTLSLGLAPSQKVTIPLSVSDASEASLSTATVQFTPSDWSTPQTVTVTGLDDAIDDGNISYSVLLGALQSSDPSYNGLNPADLTLSNTDNDTAGITVSAPSGTSTSESGDAINFTVVLTSEPVANVTLPLSSSNSAEGTISPSSLLFTPANWNTPQTVTVTGVDDLVYDGTKTYTAVIGVASSSDSTYNGRNPADITLSNLDNDPAPSTKFFVVNDNSPDRTFEYASDGLLVENYALASTNTAPRGIATNADGSITWVLDANRRVFVYDNSGTALGNWVPGGLPNSITLEGIATDGTHIWIVDARADRVYYYANAASLLSGSPTVTGSTALASGNSISKDLVFGRDASSNGYLWVVNDASTDSVFRYAVNAGTGAISPLNNWVLGSSVKAPTGVALDPATTSGDLWVVNNGSPKQIFRYANGRNVTTSSAPAASLVFTLNSANGNPQGLADPPASPTIPNVPGLPELPQTGVNADLIRTVGPLANTSPRRVEAWLDEVESLVRRSYPGTATSIVRSVLKEALAAQRRLLRRKERRGERCGLAEDLCLSRR
ncbi:MAG: S8 family serine peptidase [Cyanobium sp.]